MHVQWRRYAEKFPDVPIVEANLDAKAALVGRVGLSLLSCGTGAFRVRSAMNTMSTALGLTCNVNIGLVSLDYTCFDDESFYSQSLSLTGTGVNTTKLHRLESFVREFAREGKNRTAAELNDELDAVDSAPGLHTPLILGLSSALACMAFTFLLGGGPIEMLCAFFGAGVGNYLRSRMGGKKLTLFSCIFVSVSAACLVYAALLAALEGIFHVSNAHQAGYICAMLFIIPGFPFITSGIDLAKQDMRSGLERLAYAVMIVVVATVTAWVLALILGLKPVAFPEYAIAPAVKITLWLIFSFCGVFGFSMMFNSSVLMASTAAAIGAVSNTLRLILANYAGLPPAVAAFLGALTAGLLASAMKNRLGYPRISITVPSIVIMVPGLFFYRAVYNLGTEAIGASAESFAAALMILLAIPLGLVAARILTDRSFRYCS